MSTAVEIPAGVGAWQVTCSQCGGRYAVLVGLDADETPEEHRPRFCSFCMSRVVVANAVQPHDHRRG